MIRTVIAINEISKFKATSLQKPTDIFTPEEIDRLSADDLHGKTPAELSALQQKLSDTQDELEAPEEYELDSPEWQQWDERLDKISDLILDIEDLLRED